MLEKAAEFISQWEGLRLKAYKDQGGIWTIGYGTTKGVYKGMEITPDRAIQLLMEEIWSSYQAVARLTKVILKENQFIALVSFTYNCGSGTYQHSTLRQKINRKEFVSAATEFLRYNKVKINGVYQVARGLTNRRKAEMNLFSS